MPWPTKPKMKIKSAAPERGISATVKTSGMSSGAPSDEPWSKQPSEPSPATAAAHLRAAAKANNS